MNVYLSLLALFFLSNCYSQNAVSKIYTNFNNTINFNNTPIGFGELYKEKYRKKKGNHNFFLTDQFKKGNIKYDGNYFYNINLKYDLVDDAIILNFSNLNQSISIICEKKNISSFEIDKFHFVNTEEYGFVEVLLSKENFSIFKKHKKIKKEIKDEGVMYYTFKDKREELILFYQNIYYPVSSKKDFIKIFPEEKQYIIEFFHEKNKFKNDFKVLVSKLMNQILASKENKNDKKL